MSTTITYTGQLVVVTCWCGTVHAIPSDLDRWASESRDNAVYCPLGHKWIVRTSIEQKLKAERDRVTALRSQLDQERARAEHEASRAAGYKGALTKTKKRIAGGACPCCNRSFVDLARHMKGQHPDFVAADPTTRGAVL